MTRFIGLRRLRGSCFAHVLVLVGLLFTPLVALAGTPQLVFDINQVLQPVGSHPVPLGKLGNELYFIANPLQHAEGAALYKTDGTTAGTVKVKPLGGFGVLSDQVPVLFIPAGAKAYFLAFGASTGQEVWVTDGTEAGTHLVSDLWPGPDGNPHLLGLLGTDLIFAESRSATDWQVFRTDGTSAGTRAITTFAPSTYGKVNESLIANGKIYLVTESTAVCCNPDLWVSTGEPGGATRLTPPDPMSGQHLQPRFLRRSGDSILFVATGLGYGTELARVDIATDVITVFDPLPAGSGVQFGSQFAVMDNFVLYIGNGVGTFYELYRLDSMGGSTLVKDIAPGVATSMPGQDTKITRVGDRAVFLADDGQNGRHIWSSDGTLQGTVPLIAAPSEQAAQSVLLGIAGTRAYFAVFTGADYRVVVTDGTVAGTHVLHDAGPIDMVDAESTYIAGDDTLVFIHTLRWEPATGFHRRSSSYVPQTGTLTVLRDRLLSYGDTQPVFDDGRLLFLSDDDSTGIEPWISDGTAAGTRLLKNIASESLSDPSSPHFFTDLNGTLVFAADDGVHGTELWKSDGTAAGTALVTDFLAGEAGSSPSQLFAWNGSLYFMPSGVRPRLMRADATLTTIEQLAILEPPPLPPDADYSNYQCLYGSPVVFRDKLYFAAADILTSGLELWSTDGTAAGTSRVADIAPGSAWSSPCGLVVFKDRLYFRASAQGTSSFQLWSTDGTAAGTVPFVSNVFAKALSTTRGVVYNNELYFAAEGGNGTLVTVKTDGTVAGTVLLNPSQPDMGIPFGVSNGRLVLTRSNGSGPHFELWTSDGSAAGTTQIPDASLPLTAPLVTTTDRIYFVSSDSGGVEPWVSDGTPAGTRRLADLNPNGDSTVRWFVNFRGVMFLATTDAVNGSRIFRTDGTTAGTVLVGSAATPNGVARVAGQNLFFAGVDSTAGLELNAVRNEAPVVVNDTASSANGAAIAVNVLANDADTDGSLDPSSLQIVSQPAHGTVSVAATGAITFTPTTGYAGSDFFTYSVADNQGHRSSAATVGVTVTQPPATAPSAPPAASESGGGGGGGALDALAVLLLASLAALHQATRAARARRVKSAIVRPTRNM
jgi:ELWxxDGT repeat protein